ncbi:hypothetical protein A6R71_16655 [Xanthomonas translucens pv. arrhenatheri]|nr:hypothetical protein A6R71_16655 [Xanthomonas translucens pv. arrhenatheri]
MPLGLPYAFPFHELPRAGQFRLPIYQAAVLESNEANQSPEKMAYYIAATACCAAAQGLFDVDRPTVGPVGLSMYTLICAKSGERKTRLDSEFFDAFIQMGDELAAAEVERAVQDRRALRAWTRKDRALNAKYAAQVKNGEDTAQTDQQISLHEMSEPVEREAMKLVFKDANVQSIKKGLAALPAVAWLSSDSWKLLNEAILPSDVDFCQIWSGERLDVARVTTGNFVVADPRLTKSLMLQPDKLVTLMRGRGKESIGSGYMARLLFSHVGSTQGKRKARMAPVSRTARNRFTDNLKELLREYIDSAQGPKVPRKILKLSPEGAHVWLLYLDHVEHQINPGGRYHGATDHASKLADMAARLAAAFHVTERFEGDIGVDCVLAAIALCDEASEDYMEHIVPKSQDELDAMRLYDWMRSRIVLPPRQTRIKRYVDLREITTLMKFCPYEFRGAKIHRLLGILETKGLVRISRHRTKAGGEAAIVEFTTPPPRPLLQ